MDLSNSLIQQYTERAEAERTAGGKIEINTYIPYVALTMSDGTEYFFQGHEADNLLNEVYDNICPEDYILAMAQNW